MESAKFDLEKHPNRSKDKDKFSSEKNGGLCLAGGFNIVAT